MKYIQEKFNGLMVCVRVCVCVGVRMCSMPAGDTRGMGLISGSEKSPGGGNGNPFQYSSSGNSMGKGA